MIFFIQLLQHLSQCPIGYKRRMVLILLNFYVGNLQTQYFILYYKYIGKMNKFFMKPLATLGSTTSHALMPRMVGIPKININFMFFGTQGDKGSFANKPLDKGNMMGFQTRQNQQNFQKHKDQLTKDQYKNYQWEKKDQDRPTYQQDNKNEEKERKNWEMKDLNYNKLDQNMNIDSTQKMKEKQKQESHEQIKAFRRMQGEGQSQRHANAYEDEMKNQQRKNGQRIDRIGDEEIRRGMRENNQPKNQSWFNQKKNEN